MRPTVARGDAPAHPTFPGLTAFSLAAAYLRIATITMLWSDLKFAVRGLIKAPGLSAAAVLALMLGIGPNTAIFSLVHATLLAPLPYPDPDQLVRVTPMVRD